MGRPTALRPGACAAGTGGAGRRVDQGPVLSSLGSAPVLVDERLQVEFVHFDAAQPVRSRPADLLPDFWTVLSWKILI